MVNGNPSAIGAQLFTDIGIDTKVSRNRVLDFYRDFRSELGDLMKNLMNDDEDLVVGGYRIDSGQKNGAAATYLVNSWLSEQEFIFSQLLESYKFEQKLDDKINNF